MLYDDDEEPATSLFFGAEIPTRPREDGAPAQMLGLASSRDGDDRIAYLDELGRLATQAGRYADAWSYLQRVLELQRSVDAPAPARARTCCRLAVVAARRGELDEAGALLRAAAALTPDIHASVLHNLAFLARRAGALDEAEALYGECLALKLETCGWEDPSVAATLGARGQLELLRGRPTAALRHLLPARHIYELCAAAVSSGMGFVLTAMGRAYRALGMLAHAMAAFERALAVREAIQVPPEQLACSRYHLAAALWPGAPAEAQGLARAALAEYERGPCPQLRHVRVMQAWIEHHQP